MKLKIILGTAFLAVVSFVAISASRNRPFAPASDLPRDALVYAQFEDLPALIKLWNQSSFKAKYLASKNFKDLSSRHLGLKLAGRWQEFSDAAGFPIDLDVVSGLADRRAAIAIYDIGKLDFVFIAPMKGELFEATRFMQNPDKFEEQDLDDGTRIYRVKVDADRGRQKQELLFTDVKGRLIIATSEKLLVGTISIVTGRTRKSSLADDPAFAALQDRVTPHTMALWADQKALNNDYYFKHYWLMQDVDGLKNFRAGLFNLSIDDHEIFEEREFLLNNAVSQPFLNASAAAGLLSRVPDDAAFYRIQNAKPESIRNSIRNVISTDNKTGSEKKRISGYRSVSDRYYDDGNDYDIGEKFDENIDDTDSMEKVIDPSANSHEIDYNSVLQISQPGSILTLAKTRMNETPLFADFDRAVVFTLGSPGAFDRTAFESAISRDLAGHLLVEGQNLDVRWVSKNENGSSWRELHLPELGRFVEYTVVGNRLILANEPAFFFEILRGSLKPERISLGPVNEYTVIKVPAAARGFRDVFNQMSEGDGDFFVGNIASLLDSALTVDKIAVRTANTGKTLKKEIRLTFH